MQELRTLHSIEKEARELQIYSEFQRLASQPGAMKSQVTKIIGEKFKIHSLTTVNNIRKRVEKRLSQTAEA